MGLFDYFSPERRLERQMWRLVGKPYRRFQGRSAAEMGRTLIALWGEYRSANPTFDPKNPNDYLYMLDAKKAFKWICLQLGYDEGWADAYIRGCLRLGDLAYRLLGNDLLWSNNDSKKYIRAVLELHRCFAELLPDQIGTLETQKQSCERD
jgi:hypothetical protein